MNFEEYKTALEAAGFTFDGEFVRDALGNPVAGKGPYGEVWCKSGTVETIMTRPAPKPKAKKKVDRKSVV